MKIDGGCHCGFITYEAEADPDRVYICHCTDCQALSGSAFRTIVPVTEGSFRFLSGEPTLYVKTAESGNKRQQTFCPKCGSPIYSANGGDGPRDINVRVGTVRQRDQLVPAVQTWIRSAQHWLEGLASIRRTEKDTS